MKYRLYGDTVQLVKYVLTVEHKDEGTPAAEDAYTDTYYAVTDEERDALLARYPDAVVTEEDNTGYEYLDGEVFTSEEIRKGKLDEAVAIGARAYEDMKNAPTQEEINADLLFQNAILITRIEELEAKFEENPNE